MARPPRHLSIGFPGRLHDFDGLLGFEHGQVIATKYLGSLLRPDVKVGLAQPVRQPHTEPSLEVFAQKDKPPLFVLQPANDRAVLEEGAKPLLALAQRLLRLLHRRHIAGHAEPLHDAAFRVEHRHCA